MADINKIAEELGTLTILEAADLVKLLEEKRGVSAAAPVAAAGAAAAPAEAEEEKTEFNVVLTEAGANKIAVIKAVREVKAGQECGLSLKGYDDIKVGDQLEVFEVTEVARTL